MRSIWNILAEAFSGPIVQGRRYRNYYAMPWDELTRSDVDRKALKAWVDFLDQQGSEAPDHFYYVKTASGLYALTPDTVAGRASDEFEWTGTEWVSTGDDSEGL